MNVFTKIVHGPSVILAAFVAIATLLAISSGAQAQGTRCVRYSNGPDRYIAFDGDDHIQGSVPLYDNAACTDNSNTESISTPAGGWVFASSENAALLICQQKHGNEARVDEETRSATSNVWRCVRPRRVKSKAVERPTPTPKPFVATGLALNQTDLRLSAEAGLESGIQFQRLDAPGVGIDGVIAMGLLDAVDVWGIIKGSYTVCFPQHGVIYFLDAGNAPRTAMRISAFADDGFTCGSMDRAGTLVLVQDDGRSLGFPTTQAETQTGVDSALAPDDSVEITLSNCEVQAQHDLRLRNGPAGGVIGFVPAETSLQAGARTADWFSVVYEERQGWIAAWLTDTEGACEYPLIVG